METDLCQPAAAPCPVSFNWVDHSGYNCRIDTVGKESCSFSHSTRYDGSSGCTEYKVKYEIGPVKICIICKNVKAWLSDKTHKIFTKKQTKTDQDKHNSTNTKIHQILHQDISCIFCSGKTSLNHCKTSLHPEYERSTN